MARISQTSDDATATGNARRWWIASVLLSTVVFGFFDRISVAVLFSWVPFQDAMGTGFNPAKLGLLMSVFLFAFALSAVFLSFTGDLFGHKRAMLVSTTIWGLAMAGMGAAASYPIMLVGRAILGVAEGPQFSFAAALVRRWFPEREHGRANAIWLVGSPLGSAIGFALIGSVLVPHFGWRNSFYILGAANLLIVVPLILFVVKERPATTAWNVPPADKAYRADVSRFARDRKVWLLVIYNVGALIYLWGLNSWLPTYLVKSRGIDLQSAGWLSSLPFLMMFIGEIVGAVICDRIGRHAVIAGCGMTVAAVMMYVGTQMATPTGAVIAMGLSTLGWGIAIPVFFALALRVLPAGAVAAGIGLINGIGNLIGALAPVLIGTVIAQTGSFESGLLVLVAGPLISAICLFSLAHARVGRSGERKNVLF